LETAGRARFGAGGIRDFSRPRATEARVFR
jgi:hypothetical protein